MTPAKVKMVAFIFAESKQTKRINSPSHISELEALETLRNDGILTENEFQKQKAKILGNTDK